jgi:hypothetical protein
MKKSLIAVVFLIFAIGLVVLSGTSVKKKQTDTAIAENLQTQNILAVADDFANLQDKQALIENRLLAVEQRKILSDDDVRAMINAISTVKAQEIVNGALKQQYYPTAYCLSTPNADGGFDLSCRNTTA